MKLFKYSLEKSFNELCSSVKADSKNPVSMQEIQFRLGTCLHWMINSWERIKQTSNINRSDDHNSYFSALEYANNQLKHSVKLVELSQTAVKGHTFPMRFPCRLGTIFFKWAELKPNKRDQFANYQGLLQGKDIIVTMQQGKDIVFCYFDKLENEVTP